MVDHVIQFCDVIVGPYNVHAMVATLVSGREPSNLKLSMSASLNYPHPRYLLHQNKLHYVDQHLTGYQSVSGILDLSIAF